MLRVFDCLISINVQMSCGILLRQYLNERIVKKRNLRRSN